jgi:hypothetical protein
LQRLIRFTTRSFRERSCLAGVFHERLTVVCLRARRSRSHFR